LKEERQKENRVFLVHYCHINGKRNLKEQIFKYLGNQKYIKSWRRKKAKFISVIEKQCKVGHGESKCLSHLAEFCIEVRDENFS